LNTDLIVLLCYYINLDSHYLFLRPEPKKSTTKCRIWNIRATREKLGQDICNNILIQSILGHETTSHLYEIENGIVRSKHEQAKVFHSLCMILVIDVEKALVLLHNGMLTTH